MDPITVDAALCSLLSKEQALSYGAVPLFEREGVVHMGGVGKGCFSIEDDLSHLYGKRIVWHTLSENHFKRLFFDHFGPEHSLETPQASNPLGAIYGLLGEGIRCKASDIHLEPMPPSLRIRYRMDGVLGKGESWPLDLWGQLSRVIKIKAHMDILKDKDPQGGQFSLTLGGHVVTCRVSTHPTIHGESMVLRLLNATQGIPDLSQLGFQPPILALLKKIPLKAEGMVFVTGPTGSGKSTTLHALLAEMDLRSKNVMSLEDPVEYKNPWLRQSLVGPDFSFAEGARSLLRQDPDALFIGEVRDRETARIALRAALTGHPVYTTLHAPSSLGVLKRLVQLGITWEEAVLHARVILNQRLVQVRCCKEVECTRCGGRGFKGRIPLMEVLFIEGKVQENLLRDPDHVPSFITLRDRREALRKEGVLYERA